MHKHILSLFLAAMVSAPAWAQETTAAGTNPDKQTQSQATPDKRRAGGTNQGIKVELNKLEALDNACRTYLVIKNRTEQAFENLRLDLVMFDQQSIVAKRLAVEAAPLPADKTTLKVFDINKLECSGIGRILLNDILTCRDTSGKRSDCLRMLSVTSRGDVPFLK